MKNRGPKLRVDRMFRNFSSVYKSYGKIIFNLPISMANSNGEQMYDGYMDRHANVQCETIIPHHYHLVGCKNDNLGPVVQSVISLTSSLRVISLTVLADSIYILIFFAEKMFAKATHIFSAKNFSIFAYHSM